MLSNYINDKDNTATYLWSKSLLNFILAQRNITFAEAKNIRDDYIINGALDD